MIVLFRVLVAIFAIIGIFTTVGLFAVAIQGRIERKKSFKRIEAVFELYNAISNPVYECRGCALEQRLVEDHDDILTCLKCRRSYVEGSDERKEYSDYYIAERVYRDE